MRFGRRFDGLPRRWFAWRPVFDQTDDRWVWLEWVWRIRFRFSRDTYSTGLIRGRSPSEKEGKKLASRVR